MCYDNAANLSSVFLQHIQSGRNVIASSLSARLAEYTGLYSHLKLINGTNHLLLNNTEPCVNVQTLFTPHILKKPLALQGRGKHNLWHLTRNESITIYKELKTKVTSSIAFSIHFTQFCK